MAATTDFYPGKAVEANNKTVQEEFSYPTGAKAVIFPFSAARNGTTAYRHLIFYAGAPSTLFANAPYGSVLIDETNAAIYINVAGTWTTVNS